MLHCQNCHTEDRKIKNVELIRYSLYLILTEKTLLAKTK